MHTNVLADHEIRERLHASPPLIENLTDEATQVQACGVDLSVRTVSRFLSGGAVDFDNSGRALAPTEPLTWERDWLDLPPGAYHVVYNEVVNLPRDIMALAYPRSSLLRCGATIYTAVWDPGYSGRAETLLVVHNPHGFRLRKLGRVAQLVFTMLGGSAENGYNGRFKGENLPADA